MISTATRKEQIQQIDEKLAVLQARKRELEAKEKAQERKARTKRLIEVGAEVESVLGRPIPKEDLPKLRAFLQDLELRGNHFSNYMR